MNDRLQIIGSANPTASVAVNGNTAYRKREYFWDAENRLTNMVANTTVAPPQKEGELEFDGDRDFKMLTAELENDAHVRAKRACHEPRCGWPQTYDCKTKQPSPKQFGPK
jgi:hypothetical protein